MAKKTRARPHTRHTRTAKHTRSAPTDNARREHTDARTLEDLVAPRSYAGLWEQAVPVLHQLVQVAVLGGRGEGAAVRGTATGRGGGVRGTEFKGDGRARHRGHQRWSPVLGRTDSKCRTPPVTRHQRAAQNPDATAAQSPLRTGNTPRPALLGPPQAPAGTRRRRKAGRPRLHETSWPTTPSARPPGLDPSQRPQGPTRNSNTKNSSSFSRITSLSFTTWGWLSLRRDLT